MQKKFQVLTLVCAIAAGMMGSASVLATPTYRVGATAQAFRLPSLTSKAGTPRA